ncbi:MAG: ABC transporter permease [Desulfomonilaceae bacterium]|jgi:ABC-type nitrate/sulfonate/bicarbonate transport system permease component
MGRYLSLLILLCLWQGLCTFGIVSNYVLPAPLEIAAGFWSLLTVGMPPGHLLYYHIIYSLYRVSLGFSLACVLGVPLGLLMGWFPRFNRSFSPIVEIIRPIPPLAWIPIAIVWFGIGMGSAAFIIFLGAFFPILLNTASGVFSVSPILIDAARTLNASQKDIFFKVLVPGALPSIFVGMRVGMGVAWMTLVAAEFSGVKDGYGLGFMIMTARDIQKPDQILAGMLVIGLIGVIIDWLFRAWESRIRPCI